MKNYGDSSTEPSLFGMTGHLDYVAKDHGGRVVEVPGSVTKKKPEVRVKS